MQIIFDKSLLTGNELIDSEHRELIARVNQVTSGAVAGSEKAAAVKTLDFLMDYVDIHFKDEEGLQLEYDYPLLAAHKAQHAKFAQTVEELREMLEEEQGPTDAFVEAVNRNVVNWLLMHIQVWDRQVAEFIKER